MPARGHFVFLNDAKNHKVLVIWDLNGYGEYAFDWCICDKVMRYAAKHKTHRGYRTHELTCVVSSCVLYPLCVLYLFAKKGGNNIKREETYSHEACTCVANEGLVFYIGGDYSLRLKCYVTCTICQQTSCFVNT